MGKGRKPIPTGIKILKGNPGRRPLNKHEPKPDMDLPYPPNHLDKVAKLEWRRVGKQLNEIGVLSKIDRTAFAGYCQVYSDLVAAIKMIKDEGSTLERANGTIMAHPMIQVKNTALSLMLKYLVEFGLTPSSRSKIIAFSGQKENDPLDQFIDTQSA